MSRLGTLLCILMTAPLAPAEDWPNYGNDKGGTRYSPLNQINRSNVRRAAGGGGKFETRPGDGYCVFALPSGAAPGTQQ